jgi:formate hydrogenlyase subunit 4
MMHEGLTLEYSGWQLALVNYAGYIRQLSFFVIGAIVLLPGLNLAATIGGIVALAVAITLVETAFAKVRLFEVPQVLTTAFILAAVSVGLRLFGGIA